MFLLAAVTVLAAGCRDIKRQVNDLLVYPTTAEEVAATAKDNHSDAALVVTKADTQYVLYRRASAFTKSDGIQRCHAMRYVSQHRCRHDFSARGGEFRLYEPEQPVVLTRNGDNALVLTVDSVVIAVEGLAVTDSVATFRFGFDEPDREATLYLYDKARDTKDIFAETTIQQMLSLALSMDFLITDREEVVDTGYVEAGDALQEASLALEAAEVETENAGDTFKAFDCYAEYSRMDSLAMALGFTNKESVAVGDNYLKYVAIGSKNSRKDCYARMERMSEAAKTCHCKRYVVEHLGPWHRKCRFTIEW